MVSKDAQRKLLIDLFNWADTEGLGKISRREFTYFMFASTLSHAYFEVDKNTISCGKQERTRQKNIRL